VRKFPRAHDIDNFDRFCFFETGNMAGPTLAILLSDPM
jgi:hypothetical protein